METNLFFSLFLLFTSFFLLFIARKCYKPTKNLPPGPRQWPIIGSMLQMRVNPHIAATKFAKQYGPLISFRLGSRLVVAASSPEAAIEILKTQDRLFSARSIPHALHQSFQDFYFVWAADCNDHWKLLRTLCRTELFSAKAIEGQSRLRNEKLTQMLEFLRSKQGEVMKIEEIVFATMLNTLSNIIFGKDFLDLNGDHGIVGGFKENLVKILEAAVTPNVSDFFPMVERLDLQGLQKGALKNLQAVSTFWEPIIQEKRARRASVTPIVAEEKHFLDRLLENEFTNAQINILALELFIAGTDTVTSTVEWAMADLLKNEEAMKKVQEELKNNIKSNIIIESELSKLPYLNACIKESLRLHPVVPLLIPRRAVQTCEVMNYTIPRNTQVWINIWAISLDPQIWEDPLSFKPERFLDSNLDYKGQDFEFIPFGAGRRMCPGLPSGIKSVQAILTSLILQFDWILPNNENPAKLDMNGKFGVTMQKEKPLELIFKHRE